MRFFWKATPESRDHAGLKCKIMRKVDYPETIDVYDFCSEPIQTLLKINREIEDKRLVAFQISTRDLSTSIAYLQPLSPVV